MSTDDRDYDEYFEENERFDEDEDDSSFGPRRAALEERRSQKRKRRTLLGTTLIVLGVLAAAALTIYAAREVTSPDEEEPQAPATTAASARTTLLFGTLERASGEQDMVWASLLVYDPEEVQGAVAYMPAHTAVEVPGRGLLALKDAYEGGGIPLLLVTAENLLGVTVDRYLQISENDALVLMQQVGDLTVDVPQDVRVRAGQGSVRIVIPEGRQDLSPRDLTTLLFTLGTSADDIDLGTRHLAFWDALFDAYSPRPDELEAAITAAAGSLGTSDAKPEAFARLFGDLSTLSGSARRLRTLPVTPLEVPGNRLYVTDRAEIDDFVAQVVGEAAMGDQVRVQILNGNGAPGIGQQVAERLVGEGFRVILSGNAKRLDYENTLILVYEDSGDTMALAERAQELLGVGEVRVSTQEQGIVDMTIVVGKDFLRSQ